MEVLVMNKPTLSVFIGLPGSSVVEKAVEYSEKEQIGIINLTVDSLDVIKTALESGMSVAVIANNLYQLVSRCRFLSLFTKIECYKECHFVLETYDECLKHATSVDELDFAYSEFVLPWYYEGWDKINVIKIQSDIDSINHLLYNDKDGLVNKILQVMSPCCINLKATINAADLSLMCYQEAKSVRLNSRILKSLLLMYAGDYIKDFDDSIDNKYGYVGILKNPYESLFYNQINEHSDELLRIVNNNHVLDDLYVAILIQWGDIFTRYLEDSEQFVRIHNMFGKDLCQDLLDRKEVIDRVIHAICVRENSEN